ncbi:MAG: tetratricopeptide repeat protein [Flavobacteriaceae bacterium]|nr:tetratricopeptide repeat protein [Flavobacteriaceae bacterium]
MKLIKTNITTIGLTLILSLFFFGNVSAQKKNKELVKIEKETQTYLSEANSEISNDKFEDAEVNYRKAIALSPSEEIGKYNLGNAYYNKAKNEEAMRRFAQAAEVSNSKKEKHRAFHNLGNTFMNAKKYAEAVEAYKDALRNNPTDDETRYNLALAKDLLEKNPPQGGDGDDKNEDKKDDKEDENESEDKKDDEGNEKEGDEGEEKEDEDKGDEKDQNKEGEDKEKEGEPKDDKKGEGDDKKEQPKPVPGQLSPQQIKNLLDAMNNEEKKVQDKINAQKQKGAKVKSNKDW